MKLFALRTIADDILKSMLFMFYGKEGVMFEGLLCLAYGQPSKKKKENQNFKVAKNKVVVEIRTHFQQPFR